MFTLFQFGKSKNHSGRTAQKRRLALESLEERQLLAVMSGMDVSAAAPAVTGASLVVTTTSDVVNADDGVVSLREALASATKGDTVTFDVSGSIVLDSTLGTLLVNEGITVDGTGAGITVDGNDAVRVFTVKGTETSFKGLTITGGFVDEGGQGKGGAIYYENWASEGTTVVTIEGCVFSGNTAKGYGGDVCVFNASAYITDCTFTNFTGETSYAWNGEGLALMNYAKEVIVDNCVFENLGTAYFGGGLYVHENSSNVTVKNSVFQNNTNFRGSAVYVNAANPDMPAGLTFENCDFLNNSVSNGYAVIYSTANGQMTFIDCDFVGNTGKTVGGAIYSEGVTLNIYGGTFVNNTCSSAMAGWGGGAIYTQGDLYINRNTENSYVTLFEGNQAKGDSEANGGAIMVYNSVTEIADAIFRDNHADQRGGAFSTSNGDAYFFNTLFVDNNSVDSGGAFNLLNGDDNDVSAVFEYCSFANNTADGHFGDAIFAQQVITLTNSIVALNGTCDIFMHTGIATANVSYSVIGTYDVSGAAETTWVEGDGVVYYTDGMALFTDAANDDYTLVVDSSAVDTSNGTRNDQSDLAGNNGCVNEISDMGCYEYQTSVIEPLAVPANVATASAGANRVTVTWDAVENASGYTLAWSTDQTNWTESSAVDTSYTVTGLTYAATVYYKVKAVGDGVAYSDSEFSAAVGKVVCPMDIDSDGRVGPSDRTSLSLAWFTNSTKASWDVRADIDGDGFIGPNDRNYLSLNWMKSSTASDMVFPAANADAVFASEASAEEEEFAAPGLDVDLEIF